MEYLVWSPDFGEEPEAGKTLVEAEPQDAAETWAEQHDQEGDYDADGTLVKVRELATGQETAWKVYVEYEPVYRAVKE